MNRKSRWHAFGASIFTQMSQLAREAGAINLAQGFPDFDGPDAIKDAAVAAMRAGHNQYAPSYGLPELREKIARRKEKTSGLTFSPDREITVFSGATEALFCAIVGILEPGDEIIAFEPFYDSYPQGAAACGAVFKSVALKAPHWEFSRADLEKAISPKTRALIVNTPHNPTGKVFTREELKVIADLAVKHDLIVISDEVYEEIIFTPAEHISIASLPGMAGRTVTISSTSKTFSMTGWKVGYAFAPAPLTELLRGVHQATVFCSATPLQYGMLAAFDLPESYYQDLRAEYARRRDHIHAILKRHGFKAEKPNGSYFVLADYSAHFDAKDVDVAKRLTNEAKVATIPVSVFFAKPDEAARELRYLRFGFCKDLKTLDAADQAFTRYFSRSR